MKVLVTGAAGFIGSHAVDALITKGAQVTGVDSLDPGVHLSVPAYLNPKADWYFKDLRQLRPVDRFHDVEAVIHYAALGGLARAAREPADVVDANVRGTMQLIEAMAGWPRLRLVVLASSFSVYGSSYTYQCSKCGATRDGHRELADLDQGRFEVLCRRCGEGTHVLPLNEDVIPVPIDLYGASKYMQELCFRNFSRCSVAILRQSSVYGRRMRLADGEATIIARIAGWTASGASPRLLEDGQQIRDWVYVGDAVDAVLALLEREPASRVLNVCTGYRVTLSEACDLVAAAQSVRVAADVVGGFRLGDMRHCLGDATALTALLGHAPLGLSDGARHAFGSTTSVPSSS